MPLGSEEKKTVKISPGILRKYGPTEKLETRAQPRRADHSYNGIMFDIQAKGPATVQVTSIWVGGLLGPVSIYACLSGSWNGKTTTPNRWILVSEGNYSPSWNIAKEIPLTTPVWIYPTQTRGFYVHSQLMNDRGIQYQSCWKGSSPTCENSLIRILPGVGHTSDKPFDGDYGWFRGPRTLAGAVSYVVYMSLWSPRVHKEFPDVFQNGLRYLLLCHYRTGSTLSKLPKSVLFHVFTFMHLQWFEKVTMKKLSVIGGVLKAVNGFLNSLPV
jgi:hypothetical protein